MARVGLSRNVRGLVRVVKRLKEGKFEESEESDENDESDGFNRKDMGGSKGEIRR